MAHNLPLPFPVRDAADLKRAVRHVTRSDPDNRDAQRYVVARARALGHVDLIPTRWTHMTTTKLSGTSLDWQFDELAEKHHISASRLKTVYFRGVDEFLNSDMTFGSATMYGLARVQRFINGNDTADDDLRKKHEYSEETAGYDLTDDTMFFMPDVLYASGASVVELFRPGQVTTITVSDDDLQVDGVLGDLQWSYALDTCSGEFSFRVQ